MSQIKWTNAAGGDFATATDWSTSAVPGAGDDAILQALSMSYTVTTSGSPTVNSIQLANTTTLSITGGTFTATSGTGSGANNGLILINDNTTFQTGGTISGAGTILINGVSNDTTSLVLASNTTLQGGGLVSLEVNNGTNYIYGSAAGIVLNNVSDTIAGAGQLGNGTLTLKNGAAGVIDATGSGVQLVVNVGGANATNAGLMEATAAGGLRILNSTVTQSGTGTIKAVGSGDNVNLDTGVIVGGTLATSGGGFIESVNTGELSGVTINAGAQVYALDNSSLLLDGTITNKGTITINGTSNDLTNLILNTATVTLTGAGTVMLEGNNGTNRIYSNSTTTIAQLVNVNNTIQGAGQIGLGQLALDNRAAGVIDATGPVAMTIQTNSFSNEGLVESTTGTLNINGSTITNTGTIASIGDGSTVLLYNGTDVIGGLLKTTGTGVIQSGGATLDGSTHTGAVMINANSNVLINDNAELTVLGTISNAGTITINGVGNDLTDLIFNSPTVTLTGGGVVQLETNNGTNRIYSNTASDKLVNVNNTIQGSGQLGANAGDGSFDNQAGGIIDANGAGVGMSINANVFTNEGLIESTATSGLTISSTITNTGTIGAFGTSASYVVVNDSASIVGGTLATSATGTIYAQGATFDGRGTGGITLATGVNVLISDNNVLNLDGTINNLGTITINGTGNDSTDLISNTATVTLTGGGLVQLEPNNSTNRIYGSSGTNKLVNVNNTIQGAGQIGANQGEFDNQAGGVIDANSPGVGMTIQAQSFTNEGLIESTATSGLVIESTIMNTGTIAALGPVASYIVVNSGASIVGGTLKTSATGTVYAQNATFDGSGAGGITLATGINVVVSDNNVLDLDGKIINGGTITINATGNDNTDLVFNTSTVTLTGGGVVQLEPNNGPNRIYGSSGSNLLVNVNNTIQGAGQIGANQGEFDNQAAGVIDANSANVGMTIQAQSFTNEGLIESTAATGLTIESSISNTGTIGAFGTVASYIVVNNGASIIGGTLATSPTGTVYAQNATFDGRGAGGITLATGTNVVLSDNNQLLLDGTISNGGTITINGVGNDNTDLIINTPTVTLTGGGLVQLEVNNGTNRIYGSATANKLVNVNNTIQGAGQVGAGQLTLDNQKAGVIDSNTGVGMTISLGSTFTNEGLVEATAGSGLTITNATLTNTGTIAAMSDSSVNLTTSVSLTNLNAGGTLTGGTFEAISAGGTHTSSLVFNDGSITTDNANLVVSGVGAAISTVGGALGATLTAIGVRGTLSVLNGATFASTGTLADDNQVFLTGSLTGSTLNVSAAGTISAVGGSGTISETGRITNNGVMQATGGGTLTVAQGILKNVGTLQALAGSTLNVSLPGKISNLVGGTLTGGTYAAIGNAATLFIGNGTLGTDAAVITLSGAGSVIKSGGNARTLEATLSVVASGGVLNVLAGRNFTSTNNLGLTDNGVVELGGGTLSASSITIGTSGILFGQGAVTTAITDNGSIAASTNAQIPAGTLTLTKMVSGTGGLTVTSGDTLVASGGYSVGTVGVGAGGTLINAGTASGTIGINGTLVMNGGTLSGGSIGINSAPGLLTGFGTVAKSVTNMGTIDANGGTLTLAAGESGGTLSVEASSTLVSTAAAVGAGSLTIAAGGSFIGFGTVSGATSDAGGLTASGGTLSLASATGAGTATIAGGATLALGSALTLGGGLSFASAGNAVLALGQVAGDTTVLAGFGSGDTIDIQNQSVTALTYSAMTDKLTLKSGSTTLGTLTFSGSYTRQNFSLQSDGHNGTDIVYTATMSSVPASDLAVAAAGTAPAMAAPRVAPAGEGPRIGASTASFAIASHVMDLVHHS